MGEPTTTQYHVLSIIFKVLLALDTILMAVVFILLCIATAAIAGLPGSAPVLAIGWVAVVLRIFELGLGWTAIITLKMGVMIIYAAVLTISTILYLVNVIMTLAALPIVLLVLSIIQIVMFIVIMVEVKKAS